MISRLKIAFMLWDGRVGGAERITVALASTIDALDLARAAVVFVDTGRPVLGELAAEGYEVTAFELRLGRGGNVLLHARRVVRCLRRLGVEVLFAPVTGTVGLAMRAGGYSGVLVGVEHGAMLNRAAFSSIKPWIHERALGAAVPLFDGFVAVSDVMAERVREVLGPRVFVATVLNGVDTDRYIPDGRRADGRTFRIGVAARLVPGKGVREAILALEPRLGGRSVQLRIAGDGPMRAELEELARVRGVAGSVDFLGMVRDMPSFWRACDVAVHAANGWNESFCLAVAEAQSSGLPAIVSRTGALPSVVVDGQTGVVVGPGDIEGLRQALELYALDEQLRARIGAVARSRACRLLSLERVASDYVRVACDLLNRRLLAAGDG